MEEIGAGEAEKNGLPGGLLRIISNGDKKRYKTLQRDMSV